ncbi:MAG TPA: choice-of-anchor tandem repeat GloVer-containing protein [Candidatus Solibacter sp.]|nr:choice-of-anchor tandem repeat GloVer-containing protein [Candidatus Solibacter sp.]
MKSVRVSFPVLVSVFVLAITIFSWGQTEGVVYRFGASSTDGTYPNALVHDAAGNLYGTTTLGGTFNQGTVFELVHPSKGGHWTEKILYNFSGNADGAAPSTGVVFDAAGNLYGATFYGGSGDYYTGGVIFELSAPAVRGGKWTETVLFDFSSSIAAVGFNPVGNLVFDAAGNLYGAASAGGNGMASYCGDPGCGTIFQLQPPTVAGGTWTLVDIHDFLSELGDGFGPTGVTLTQDGSIVGTTVYDLTEAGLYEGGVAFWLSRPTDTNGSWPETVLYTFLSGSDGASASPLTVGKKGVLYGTTQIGGTNNLGTVFALSVVAGNAWRKTIVYNFAGGSDGATPRAGVTFDAKGNMYATTSRGGSFPCTSNGGVGCGALAEFTSPSGYVWTEKTLYDFTGGEDGFLPAHGVLFMNGSIYGTTQLGGSATGNGAGTVFQIRP